jgi:hypothetical protein
MDDQPRCAAEAVSMQSEAPLTLILSPLRAGRGELERTRLASLFGDPNTVPAKGFPLPLGICLAPHRSAELYSAVSQSCTLPNVGKLRRVGPILRSAEYNSAIRQIENLRYSFAARHAKQIPLWKRERGTARVRLDRMDTAN